MALAYRHRRYFQVKQTDQTNKQFSNTKDASDTINFSQAWQTGNPSITESLQDDNTSYVITYEFNTLEEQTSFEEALKTEWDLDTNSSRAPWSPKDGHTVIHTKTEWLHESGEISSNWDLEQSKIELTGGMRGGRFVIDM
jgi:hypothetical protein